MRPNPDFKGMRIMYEVSYNGRRSYVSHAFVLTYSTEKKTIT